MAPGPFAGGHVAKNLRYHKHVMHVDSITACIRAYGLGSSNPYRTSEPIAVPDFATAVKIANHSELPTQTLMANYKVGG